MKSFISFILSVLFLLFVVVSHFFFSYVLPFPWSTVNIIFAVLILFLLFSQKGTVVWMAFFTHLCIELYSVSPFGIVLSSSTLSVLVMFWLFQYFFTNRSWYSSIVLTFFSLAFYRFVSFILLNIVAFFQKQPGIPVSHFFILSMWEFFFTQIIVLFGFVVLNQFEKNKRKKQFKLL